MGGNDDRLTSDLISNHDESNINNNYSERHHASTTNATSSRILMGDQQGTSTRNFNRRV